jgi:hypothetical protein
MTLCIIISMSVEPDIEPDLHIVKRDINYTFVCFL